MSEKLRTLIETTQSGRLDIAGMTREIHQTLLRTSRYLTAGNFTSFHPDDLRWLFDEYDRRFFDGRCRQALGQSPLHFRISPRMTKAGGKTGRYRPRDRRLHATYEISVSSTLLFQTFSEDDHRPITVTGLVCRDRLEALQRIFEHELVHLIEMLVWTDSKCSQPRFQSIASHFFGHTAHTHQLITPRERAYVKFGIHNGSRVRFRLDGREYTGVVNRITKRATVLVPDPEGVLYSDGTRYLKFYVPVGMLESAET